MKWVVRLGKTELRPYMHADVFCKIEINDEKLSISGVVGPWKNGNCEGGCGQIVASRPEICEFAPGWTKELVNQFYDIWERWHLNDLRPECEHQRKLGWREIARKEAKIFHWGLKTEIFMRQQKLKEDLILRISNNELGEVLPEERNLLNLPLSKTTTNINDSPGPEYEPCSNSYRPHAETKTLGWLRPSEHPDGILCKPCPECGYEYGREWKKEALPAEVIKFLENLPEKDKEPAWV